MLGRNAFDLDRILDIEPEFLHADDHDHDHDHGHDHGDGHHHHHDHGGLKHYHDEDMQSISLKTDKPLDPDKFFPWIQNLVAEDGPNILRCKGILTFKDDPERFVFQGVHMILDGDHQRAWKDGEKRDSRSCSSAAICRKRKSARVSRPSWRDSHRIRRRELGER